MLQRRVVLPSLRKCQHGRKHFGARRHALQHGDALRQQSRHIQQVGKPEKGGSRGQAGHRALSRGHGQALGCLSWRQAPSSSSKAIPAAAASPSDIQQLSGLQQPRVRVPGQAVHQLL